MKIYIFFICFNCIDVGAHNYILRVLASNPEKILSPASVNSVVPLRNMPVHNRYNYIPQKEIQRIYRKFLQPVSILKEQFPNDIIEVQLEINKSNQYGNTKSPKSYNIIKVHKQPALRAVPPGIKTISQAATSRKKTSSQGQTEVSLQIPSQAVSKSIPQIHAASRTPGALHSPALADNNSNRPVYMEDLDKAFSDFELKLASSTITNTGVDISSQSPGSLRVSTKPAADGSYNIANIVELLKKGVLVQSHGPIPTDRNLDWIQIKIPKQ